MYVTGTDTGAGKTVAACALVHALRARGHTVAAMKPVASGCQRDRHGHWRNGDVEALMAASGIGPRADVNPFALPEPTAPQLSAARAGMQVTLAPIQSAYGRLAQRAGQVLVEGVGGWAAPLSDRLDQAQLARALACDVVMVVGLRLGCLSHARLTARAVRADGLLLRGWIGSCVDPGFADAASYVQLLRAAIPAPCWGVLPHRQPPEPRTLSAHLDPQGWPATNQ
ncbi:MAG TPA: dethiobiotin synthase [Xanthomonadaceae bacterium]|nr:dethiobiotin synthase [Xanthomonadaceae bacterium]